MLNDRTETNNLSFEPFDQDWQTVQSFLDAAQTLAAQDRCAEAELRYRQALKQAEQTLGAETEGVKRVLVAQMMFYLKFNRTEEAGAVAERLAAMPEVLKSKRRSLTGLLGRQKKTTQSQSGHFSNSSSVPVYTGHMPPEIKQACQLLRVEEDDLSIDTVQKAWKREVVSAKAHPDLGGEEEMSILLNNARDRLIGWLEDRIPKLGKQFGNFSVR